jgi:hypothetical protein
MLDLFTSRSNRNCEGVSRRDFVRVGAMALGGLTLAEYFQLRAMGQTTGPSTRPTTRPIKPKAKSVIQLWMSGGPAHTDTFDPKSGIGEDYTGPLKRPIGTNVSGMQLGETLPELAKVADKFSVIRSTTHPSNGHETATYIVQTGTLPSAELVYPAMGAVVALKKQTEGGYKGVLPPYVTLTRALGRFTEAGFLGPNYQTFATGGDPNNKDFAVQGLVPPRGFTDQRMADRRNLLKSIDTLAKAMDKEKAFAEMNEYQEKAYALMLGDAKKAFDLSEEKDALRDKYGRTSFGQSCLLARRLVERGVPFVTVNMGGWDTHTNHFDAMKKLCPPLDQGFAALLADLSERGLLDSTIVVWYGEFGRTPKVAWEPPWNGGRHHYANVFSTVVAGGGFKGGQVLGSSDARGENVKDRPVYPWDISGTMYAMLGIDPKGRLPHPQGCVAYVTPPAGGEVKSGGLLHELF